MRREPDDAKVSRPVRQGAGLRDGLRLPTSEVKRNCVRVTERGEEAWSEAVSQWTRTR